MAHSSCQVLRAYPVQSISLLSHDMNMVLPQHRTMISASIVIAEYTNGMKSPLLYRSRFRGRINLFYPISFLNNVLIPILTRSGNIRQERPHKLQNKKQQMASYESNLTKQHQPPRE
jgi:hypothetical protein